MLDFFINFMNYENLGKIDNAHLARSDQSKLMAMDPSCIKLAEFHSSAVDYAKTGFCPEVNKKYLNKMWPDFMEKKEKDLQYES